MLGGKREGARHAYVQAGVEEALIVNPGNFLRSIVYLIALHVRQRSPCDPWSRLQVVGAQGGPQEGVSR